MDLLSFLGVLARRWYVVVPLMLTFVALAVYTWFTSSPTYQTSATVLLRYPIGIDQELAGRNPYLGYGNLFVPGRVITDVVASPEYAARFEAAGHSVLYSAEVDTTTQAPIIAVRSEDESAAGSTATTLAIVDALGRVLRDRQEAAGAPEASWVSTEVVEPPDKPIELNTSRIRAAGAALALGGLLSVAAAFLLEGLRRRDRPVQVLRSASVPDAPCGICGEWMPQSRMISHIEQSHALARPAARALSPVEDAAPPGNTEAPPSRNEAKRLRPATNDSGRPPPQHAAAPKGRRTGA